MSDGAAEFNTIALLLTIFGVLLISCAVLGRTVERSGVPVVFLFLTIGILAGSEGLIGIAFDDYRLAFRLGTGALILILLDGGLNTSMLAIRRHLRPALVLATFGVVATAALLALFGRVLGLTWSEAILLGSVVSSTDAAAVFAVLRGGGLRLEPRIGDTIELESGINDPMAVILTIAATQVILGQAPSPGRMAIDVPLQLVSGLATGLVLAFGLRKVLTRIHLPTAGLYPVLTVGTGLLAFGVATLLNGSGLIAVFSAALILGNGPLPYRTGLTRIHDALGWLSQVGVFLMLGLLVFPSQLAPVARDGFLAALFLSFVARPVAVLLCLLPFRFSLKEIGYIGWLGLRGAVPIVLAMIPVLSDVPGGMKVFNIVFFVAVMSAILPGVTIRGVTRWLGFEAPAAPVPPAALEVTSTRHLAGELISFYITEALAVCNASLSAIPFPPNSAAVLIVRGQELMAARGGTVLTQGDHVYVFCGPEERPFIELLFGRPQGEA